MYAKHIVIDNERIKQMRTSQRLTLSRDGLTELAPDQLRSVEGAGPGMSAPILCEDSYIGCISNDCINISEGYCPTAFCTR